jgi:hypothetical protein
MFSLSICFYQYCQRQTHRFFCGKFYIAKTIKYSMHFMYLSIYKVIINDSPIAVGVGDRV